MKKLFLLSLMHCTLLIGMKTDKLSGADFANLSEAANYVRLATEGFNVAEEYLNSTDKHAGRNANWSLGMANERLNSAEEAINNSAHGTNFTDSGRDVTNARTKIENLRTRYNELRPRITEKYTHEQAIISRNLRNGLLIGFATYISFILASVGATHLYNTYY